MWKYVKNSMELHVTVEFPWNHMAHHISYIGFPWKFRGGFPEGIASGLAFLTFQSHPNGRIKGQGGSRSLEVAPFDRPYSTFYWSAAVSMPIALSCNTFELLHVK